MSIRIRPWGSTNPDDELDVTETGLPQDTSALVAGGYEVGRIAWEGVQRTIPVPALSSATDAADGSTASTGSVSTTIGDGTLYWVITQSATSPSIAQVKAGQDHTGAAADDSGSQAVSATGVQNMAGSGLTGSTTYYTHFMHEDAAANQSTVASADGFTTAAAATVPGTMSAPTVTATSDTEISVDRAAAPSDGGSAILSYDLRYEVDGSGSWTTVTGITDPQSVTGLTASTLYNVQTRAVNAVGAGAWSASGSATTDAGSGLLDFEDDFSTYTLTNTLQSEGPYTLMSGTGNATIQSSGGTPVATVLGNSDSFYRYNGATVADDRRVTFDIKTFAGASSNSLHLLLSYVDANNYIEADCDSSGWITLKQYVGGALTSLNYGHDLGATAPATVELSLNGGELSFKLNGTVIRTVASIPATSLGNPGIRFKEASTVTQRGELSRFHIEEL